MLKFKTSSAQFRLWYLNRYYNTGGAYNISAAYIFEGALNYPVLIKSVSAVIKKHESLRTTFSSEDDLPLQLISSDLNLNFKIHNENESVDPPGLDITNRLNLLASEPFDLSEGPLLRFNLLSESNSKFLLLITMHHIISDGWSLGVLIKEITTAYKNYLNENEAGNTELPIQYVDYSEWQNEFIKSHKATSQLNYWADALKNLPLCIGLPFDFERPQQQSYKGATYTRLISAQLTEKLNAFSRTEGLTMNMVLMGAYAFLLSKYSGEKDLAIGFPVANRSKKETEGLIGFFVNTLVFRPDIGSSDTLSQLFTQTRELSLKALENQDLPFEKLVEELRPQRNASFSPLFQVFFAMQNMSIDPINLQGLSVKQLELDNTTSKFDLSLLADIHNGVLRLKFEYCTDLFKPQTIQRLSQSFESILKTACNNPDALLDEIKIISPEEEQKVLHTFNGDKVPLNSVCTVVDLIEEQARIKHGSTAITVGNKKITFASLNASSNRFANYLSKQFGIAKDNLVSVKLERSENLIIAILGILKCGGAYVPIDPAYPEKRVNYMINDSRSKVLIDEEAFSKFSQIEDSFSSDNLIINRSQDDLAYIIYTSGSTGAPKGVMITHGNVFTFIEWCKKEFNNSAFETVLAVTSVCFDLSVFEIFYTLCIGKTICLLQNALSITNELDVSGNILLNTVPSVLGVLLEKQVNLGNVKVLNLAGEPIPPRYIEQLDTEKTEVRNLYGPSEDTTYSTVYRITRNAPLLIGKPIDNTDIYILDDSFNLLPIGVTGRIYISGPGLARGYLHKEVLTAQKFIPNPFKSGARMYDTGDLGRWLDNGNIDFKGRMDDQVKLRGYRIELAEIERAINDYSDAIKQTVVAVKENKGNKNLVAYVASDSQINQRRLRDYLLEKLPAFMVPGLYVMLKSLPQTPSGKVDRNALPDLNEEDIKNSGYELVPINLAEESLIEIWRMVLGNENIDVTDNFFELGGNSIHIIKIIGEISRRLHKNITATDMIKNQTIRSLSTRLTNIHRGEEIVHLEQHALKCELTPQQYAMWVASIVGNNNAYNIPLMGQLEGHVNKDALEYGVNKIVARHNSIRTVFRLNDANKPYQHVLSPQEFKVEFRYNDNPEEINKGIFTDFDLENGPLLRVGLVHEGNNIYTYYFVFHHLIMDGWSCVVFKDELRMYYLDYINGTITAPEKPLPIQYSDYTIWLNRNYQNIFAKNEDFWSKKLRSKEPLSLPFEKFSDKKSFKGGYLNGYLNQDLTNEIDAFCKKNRVTTHSFFFTCLNTLFYKYTGRDYYVAGMPYAGRIDPVLLDQIGLYISTVPKTFELQRAKTMLENVEEQHKFSIETLDYQMVDMAKIITRLKPPSVTNKHLIFDYIFTFQNQFNADYEQEWEEFTRITNLKLLIDHDGRVMQSQANMAFSFLKKYNRYKYLMTWFVDLYNEEDMHSLEQDFITLLSYTLKHNHLTPDELIDKINSESKFRDFKKQDAAPIILKNISHTENAQDDITLKLIEIFKNILNVESINQTEDFFKVGGNSIFAIQIINEIYDTFDIQLSVIDFYTHPNIMELRRLITRSGEVKLPTEKQPILCNLSTYSQNLPLLLMFPPIFGSPLVYQQLVASLKDTHNCIGVNVPLIESQTGIIEETARLIYNQVEIKYPGETVFGLVAYSAGVSPAFEVCKLIESQSNKCKLFLIDRDIENTFERGLGPADMEALTESIIAKHHALYGKQNEGLDKDYHQAIIRQQLLALKIYRPSGKLISPLFSFESEKSEQKGAMKSWKKYTTAGNTIIEIEGTHDDALNNKNINTISETIKAETYIEIL